MNGPNSLAAMSARRAEKQGDNLNPKLLYASMPPRARRAIERRLSSMLSSNIIPNSAGTVNATYPVPNDSSIGIGKAAGSRRHSEGDTQALQKTNRGRITGNVLAKSSEKPSTFTTLGSSTENVSAAIVVATSGNSASDVRKKRLRRMRVKHRRGSGRKSKKKNRCRSFDTETKLSEDCVTSTVTKSTIHAREDHCALATATAPDETTIGSTLQGSYAAAYLSEIPSDNLTKKLTSTLMKSLRHGQSSQVMSRPGVTKTVSSFSASGPGHPHPPNHHYGMGKGSGYDAGWISANINGATKAAVPGRPHALSTYSSGNRSVHSPHLRQYRASSARSNDVVLSREQQQLGSSMDERALAAMGNNWHQMVQQRPFSSSGALDGRGDNRATESNNTHGKKFSGHTGAVGSAAAAAAARRANRDPRKSTKRFLPNLEGTREEMNRER